MLRVAKERILERLNDYARLALQSASEHCIERGHYEVTTSHLLRAMLKQPGGDVARMAMALQIDPDVLDQKIAKSLDAARQGAVDLPEFSTLLLELMQDALVLATGELSEDKIRTGTILTAMAADPGKYTHFHFFGDLDALDARAMIAGFHDLTRGSLEGPITENAGAKGQAQGEAPTAQAESALAKFGRNLTVEAAEGRIDPVFCRDAEIALMTDVLSRRRKNNPILVGDPGVGKTALAEGLALKILDDDVPPALRGCELWELDLGALQAGASVKGEFERRLRDVLKDATAGDVKRILFIDEAHVLIGGGGQQGGSDAANLLKPALARGELRAIAATTWSEYKKYFEKDAALARRFQLISLDEPSVEDCVTILRGLRSRYEETHGVYVSDTALHAAASLSARYLTGRQLPDKALDVLDTASVRVAAAQNMQPRALDTLNRRILMLDQEITDRRRDAAMRASGFVADVSPLEDRLAQARADRNDLQHRWEAEKSRVAAVLALRSEISADETRASALQADLDTKLAELRNDRVNGVALVPFEVDEDVVAAVISEWTDIPVAAMSEDDAARMLRLGDALRAVIKGQDDAIGIIHDRLKTARLDMVRETTPRGVFMLVGPSGTGKTETAEQVARHLFGGPQFFTVVNMSEFQEKHTLSRLIGSPPGYVGYGEGGVLTEAIRKKPYSVVLLDEVEKAHADIMNLFLQAFDKGVINDGEGRVIDCRNVIFFLTSNQGAEALTQNPETVANAGQEALVKALRPHLMQHFSPAMLARMRVLCYRPLTPETLNEIIGLKLKATADRLAQNRDLGLEWDDDLVATIADLAAHSENGARSVEQVIDRFILPGIAEETLTRISNEEPLENVVVSAAHGGFALTFLPTLSNVNDTLDAQQNAATQKNPVSDDKIAVF